MDHHAGAQDPGSRAADDRDGRAARFLAALEAMVPALASLSDADDEAGRPPLAALGMLRGIGALAASLPFAEGGCDLGCVTQSGDTPRFLRMLGRAGIALGRLLEGHVNALRLVWMFGTAGQRACAAEDARAGRLFGIWVTETQDRALAIRRDEAGAVLEGGKAFCSGAGFVDRALVTASDPDAPAPVMLLIEPGTRVGASRAMSGVRAAATADMTLSGIRVDAASRLGAPGDYLRPPEFASGAWRGSAVALGGLEAIVGEARAQLVARRRHENPHQAARIGRMLIACETGRLWVERAARAVDRLGMAQDPDADPGLADRQADCAGVVNLARIAVETACLEAMVDVQRALGLASFSRANRVERLNRDLATYLRQPAPDETLTEAAIRFADRPLPADDDLDAARSLRPAAR